MDKEQEIKARAMEFLIKYNESEYCVEEDGTFSIYGSDNTLTISELYDKLMSKSGN